MPADNYSDVVQALAKQIVDTCMRTLRQNFQGMIRGVSISSDQIEGEVRNVSSANLHVNAANVEGLNSYVANMISGASIDISQIATIDPESGKLYLNGVYINSSQVNDLEVKFADIWEAKIDKADIQTAVIDNLKANYMDVIDAQIATATINSAQITDLKAASAAMVNAAIDNARIGYAQIDGLSAGTALITEGVGGKLYIADLAVTEANIVDLTVGQLVVKGKDGHYYQITVTTDEEGNTHVGATEQMQIGNDEIGDLSINADEKIIEGSITAKTLNADEIFATDGTVLNLIAQRISADKLFANEGFINKLNTTDISGNSSLQLAVDTAKTDVMNQVSLRLTDDSFISTVAQTAAMQNKIREAAAPVLKIDSSRGTVFKSNNVNTILTVSVFHGSTVITNQTELVNEFGSGAYLRWQYLPYGYTEWREMSITDSHIANNGFRLALTSADVDTKITFRCLLEQGNSSEQSNS